MTTLYLRKSRGRSPLRLGFLLIPFVLACFALPPHALATCQDACLTNNNTVQGDDALINNTTGGSNTAFGFGALFSNTDGFDNTATGAYALNSNTTGYGNTANGIFALYRNTFGYFNTATGDSALANNTTGSSNTATGVFSLYTNSTGSSNTASGVLALFSNRTGSSNTANGDDALFGNTTGNNNTANGFGALSSNGHGNDNTANGVNALGSNTGGDKNTANGVNALGSNTTGSFNVALGTEAGANLTTGDRNIDIGNPGRAGESNTVRIGRTADQTATFIAGISGATVPTGVAVIVDAGGHLGTSTSAARFKDGIKPMDKASEAILALKPVTFRYKHELDPKGIPQFGLVAEEVEKVNPALVARDAEGKVFTVRYEAVNAMLLNEFLKEHRRVEDQQTDLTRLNSKVASQAAIIAQQQKGMEILIAQLKEQAAQIQKVRAQLQLNRSTATTVASDQ